jgi:indole-3-glycerol phosphate synthase
MTTNHDHLNQQGKKMDIPDVLLKIVATKKIEIAKLYQEIGLEEMKNRALSNKSIPASFKEALSQPGLSVIAEVKKASPSAGVIDPIFDYKTIAKAYESGEAAAISVLTDEEYFKGHLNYLIEIKSIVKIPILRKDFIIDPIQIYEAKAAGADAFLLIAAILTTEEIQALYTLGKSLGLDVLTEVHDKAELDKVLQTDCDIIGINNRNLRDFTVDLQLTSKLAKYIPAGKIIVGESGIKKPGDAHFLAKSGSDAVLCGECLIRSGIAQCGETIREFKNF